MGGKDDRTVEAKVVFPSSNRCNPTVTLHSSPVDESLSTMPPRPEFRHQPTTNTLSVGEEVGGEATNG